MSTIVLTANGYFWDEISDLQRIVKWIQSNKVEILKCDDNQIIHSAGKFGREGTVITIKMPLVVRLMEFAGFKVKSEKIEYSVNAVYQRDDSICQYWHEYTLDDQGSFYPSEPYKYRCSAEDRSIDHIIPVSKGGKTNFLNCVTACKFCNERLKKNLSPKEAGLKLIRYPYVPTRRVGEFFIPKFVYNPKKISHKAFYELMGWTFSHKA